jgi:hypothetical protein
MWTFKRGLGASGIAVCLAGCAAQNAMTPAPPDTKVAVSSATIVPVSAVVNQLKCDVGQFLKSFTVYNVTGTLTFSLERTTTNGWSVAVAPSFPLLPLGPSLNANFGRSQSRTHDVGDDVILNFDMQAQPDPSDDPHARTAVDQGACNNGLTGVGHIIEPEALRRQVEGIVLGAPKIGFRTVEYKGKFVLKQSDDPKASISLYIVSASLPMNLQDSSYTQQFDITLELQPPANKPSTPPASPPTETATPRHPVIYHMSPRPTSTTRRRAAPTSAAPADTEPQAGSPGASSGDAAGGLSEHLKHLTDAIPDPSPH